MTEMEVLLQERIQVSDSLAGFIQKRFHPSLWGGKVYAQDVAEHLYTVGGPTNDLLGEVENLRKAYGNNFYFVLTENKP